jgi:hypothetical protein
MVLTSSYQTLTNKLQIGDTIVSKLLCWYKKKDWTTLFENFDRRTLYAVKSNEVGKIDEGENLVVKLTKEAMKTVKKER